MGKTEENQRMLDEVGDGLIYLASPYEHPDVDVMEKRYQEVAKAFAVLYTLGVPTLSPIVYGHNVATLLRLPRGWEFWSGLNKHFEDVCAALLILQLDNWTHSIGVMEERKLFHQQNKPVGYTDMDTILEMERTNSFIKFRMKP